MILKERIKDIYSFQVDKDIINKLTIWFDKLNSKINVYLKRLSYNVGSLIKFAIELLKLF